MYAIIDIAGKQYKVKEGDIIQVEKIDKKSGEEICIDNLIMISKDDGGIITQEELKNFFVTARVIEHTKGEKIIVMKFRRRKRYRRKKGHRQKYTLLQIEKISLSEDNTWNSEKDNISNSEIELKSTIA